MNTIYTSIDCGKYNTKLAAYNKELKLVKTKKFRTKMTEVEETDFNDDMLDKGTFIVQVDDGPVYKVGNGAQNEASIETTKKTEIHKICTHTAIAMSMGDLKEANVEVAISMPYGPCNITAERLAYKDFILPEGDHKVKIKYSAGSEPVTVNYEITKRLVYPEAIGALYMYPAELGDVVGICDIGNVNMNNYYCDKFQLIQESCFTDEMGGQILINNLAQQLSAEMNTRCDSNIVASTLLRPYESRFLRTNNGNTAVEERSKKIIDNYLRDHVENIKRKMDSRRWSLDFMKLCFVGGTGTLLKKELVDVFGDSIFIPDRPEFVHVEGVLKKMLAAENIEYPTDAPVNEKTA